MPHCLRLRKGLWVGGPVVPLCDFFRTAVPGLNTANSVKYNIYHAIQTESISDLYSYAIYKTVAKLCDQGWRWNATPDRPVLGEAETVRVTSRETNQSSRKSLDSAFCVSYPCIAFYV